MECAPRRNNCHLLYCSCCVGKDPYLRYKEIDSIRFGSVHSFICFNGLDSLD
jgi:hypothetical protein